MPTIKYARIPSLRHSDCKTVVLLPYLSPSTPSLVPSRILLFAATLVVVTVAAYLLYPSNPTLQLSRIQLNHIEFYALPKLAVNASFFLLVKVENRDLYSLDYDSLVVSIWYRGKELGHAASRGGKVRARGSSYVEATLELNGLQVLHDVFYLIEDLAKGSVPLDTESMVVGHVGLFFLKFPIKARVYCEMHVNTNNQTIIHDDCGSRVGPLGPIVPISQSHILQEA